MLRAAAVVASSSSAVVRRRAAVAATATAAASPPSSAPSFVIYYAVGGGAVLFPRSRRCRTAVVGAAIQRRAAVLSRDCKTMKIPRRDFAKATVGSGSGAGGGKAGGYYGGRLLVFVATAGVALGCLLAADATAVSATPTDEKNHATAGSDPSTASSSSGDITTLDAVHALRGVVGEPCPSYGCPYLPLDVHYDEAARAALEKMQQRRESGGSTQEEEEKKSESGGEDGTNEAAGSDLLLGTAGSGSTATLTLMGYKGGPLEGQINQDRAFVISPYEFWNDPPVAADSKEEGGFDGEGHDAATPAPVTARFLGVFDGHAKRGELVSEYAVTSLPEKVAEKLRRERAPEISTDVVKSALFETFLELDRNAPADPSGGCTASVILQIDDAVFVANAGDSRSFVGTHVVILNDSEGGGSGENGPPMTAVVYASREDKPDLPDERARVEKAGGTVYVPPAPRGGTSRVLYEDKFSGGRSGLAMSRSVGDWDAGKVGVIPDPIVDVVDLGAIRRKTVEEWNGAVDERKKDGGTCAGDGGVAAMEVDAATGDVKATGNGDGAACRKIAEENVKIFAFSATDGLLDFLPVDAIATNVAEGLYPAASKVDAKYGDAADGEVGEDGSRPHTPTNPLGACQSLIYHAAQGWHEAKGGRYRDDIAIAVADLELPATRRGQGGGTKGS